MLFSSEKARKRKKKLGIDDLGINEDDEVSCFSMLCAATCLFFIYTRKKMVKMMTRMAKRMTMKKT